MYLDLDLDSTEVLADRYDPADELAPRLNTVSAAELAAWEAAPSF